MKNNSFQSEFTSIMRRGGKQVKIKRLKYQIKCKEVECITKLALLIRNDLLPVVNELKSYAREPYKLIPLDININYPDFSEIPENDPRYLTYKLRYIFGPE